MGPNDEAGRVLGAAGQVSKDELAGVQEVGVAQVPGQLVAKEPASGRG